MIGPIATPAILLAQANKQTSLVPFFTWVIVFIAFAVIGGTVTVLLRKRMLEKQSAADISGSLMEHLRDAHARGEISAAEYEQARKSMASRVSQVLDTKRAGGLFELPDPKRPARRPASQFNAPMVDPAKLPPAHPETGEVRAAPGFDLTGQPLPRPSAPE